MDNLVTKIRVARNKRILTKAFKKLRKAYRQIERQGLSN